MRRHVAAGARLLLADLWMDPSRSQPTGADLMSGKFLMISGDGQAYGESDADVWLRQTGWRKLETKPLAGPVSVIVAEAV